MYLSQQYKQDIYLAIPFIFSPFSVSQSNIDKSHFCDIIIQAVELKSPHFQNHLYKSIFRRGYDKAKDVSWCCLFLCPRGSTQGNPEMTHKNEHPALPKFIMEKMKGGIFRIIIFLNWPNEIMHACFGLV